METLASALETFFKNIGRPSTGALFLSEYALLNEHMPTVLASPYDERITAQAIFNLFGLMPAGRFVSPAEVGMPVSGDLAQRPVLTDNAIGWLVSHGANTTSLVASLLTRVVLSDVPGQEAAGVQQLIIDRLVGAEHVWSFEDAGLARVAVLLAADAGHQRVTATHFAEAALLLIDRQAWGHIRNAILPLKNGWQCLDTAYRGLRDSLVGRNAFAHDQLLSVGLFPRDELIPIPKSVQISDVRFPGYGLGLAWPGARMGAGLGPLESAPDPVMQSAILSHVLLPGLARRQVRLAWSGTRATPLPLPDAVGRKPHDGGWEKLLRRTIEILAFEPAIEAAGWNLDELLTLVASGPGGESDAPPSASELPVYSHPVESISSLAIGAVGTRLGKPPAGVLPTVDGSALRRTYAEVLTALRARSPIGNGKAARELALVADSRLERFGGARVLLIGPPGSGKSTLLADLAEASGRPFVRIDASSVVEHGWQGTTLADVAAMIFRAAGSLPEAERAVVALDEFCKLATVSHLPGKGDATQNQHWATIKAARQATLLSLLDNGPGLITFTPELGGPPIQLGTQGLLVVAAGAFQGLEVGSGAPSDRALQDYGLLPELVARLTTRIVLPPPTRDELKERFLTGSAGVTPVVELAAALGIELKVAREAVDLVVAATAASSGGLSPRTGAGLLQTAARRALLSALEDAEREATSCIVGPDEVLGLLRSAAHTPR